MCIRDRCVCVCVCVFERYDSLWWSDTVSIFALYHRLNIIDTWEPSFLFPIGRFRLIHTTDVTRALYCFSVFNWPRIFVTVIQGSRSCCRPLCKWLKQRYTLLPILSVLWISLSMFSINGVLWNGCFEISIAFTISVMTTNALFVFVSQLNTLHSSTLNNKQCRK